ncbi:MAG: signal peptidase II [Candidatus Uhrbacteria bacterium]|nr:signal peptidase II [Candidatus Uhrbacteria bacterium]
MKNLGKHLYWFLLPAILLVLLDEWAKAFALTHFPDESSLLVPSFLNLAIHKNWGLAFDIPFRREFILLISVVIGYFLIEMIVKNLTTHPKIAFSSLIIMIGAVGNVFDRIYYGFTVDYIIFFGRSAVNLSDLLIIFGVVILLISSRRSLPEHGDK